MNPLRPYFSDLIGWDSEINEMERKRWHLFHAKDEPNNFVDISKTKLTSTRFNQNLRMRWKEKDRIYST